MDIPKLDGPFDTDYYRLFSAMIYLDVDVSENEFFFPNGSFGHG